MRRRSLRLVGWLLVSSALVMLVPAPTSAFPTKLTPNGQVDFDYGSQVESDGSSATGHRPESKLFYTIDGSTVTWWAVLGTSGPSPPAGSYLWQLVDHEWTPVLQLPAADPWAKADTLFDGSTLYVSTRDDKATSGSNNRESDLYEIPYLGNANWGTESGPFEITTDDVETLTIAKDGRNRLWATFQLGGDIRVGFTRPGGTSFTFFTLSQTDASTDDISAVTSFGGGRIGVFWSDQRAKRDFFGVHQDASRPKLGWTIETAYGGGIGGCPTLRSDHCADDHVNLKAYQGRVFVAIKTGLNDDPDSAAGDPLIVLLRRSSGGAWSAFAVATISQDVTRPIALLSPDQDAIWVWGSRAGEIDVWESSFTSPAFSSTGFSPWIKGLGSANNVTSTKQSVTGATGAVVQAAVSGETEYAHNEFLPPGT